MSEKVSGYRDLLVWQKGILLAKEIYRLTRDFPQDEKWGLVSQMRRAAVSVPSNIAEGQAPIAGILEELRKMLNSLRRRLSEKP